MSCGNIPTEVKEEGEEETLMTRRREIRRVDKSICQRCRTAKSRFVIRSTAYCQSCFESAVTSRIIRQLFPALRPVRSTSKQRDLSRPPLQSGDLLLALSGGVGSMVLLDFLSHGYVGNGSDAGRQADLTKGEKSVLWRKATVIYVEFAGVFKGVEDRMEEMAQIAEGKGLGFVGLRAEDVYDPGLAGRLRGGNDRPQYQPLSVQLQHPTLPLASSSSSLSPLEKLQTLLSFLPSPSRPALLSSILNALLITAAQNIPNISHLMMGETSTRQAQRVISGTALGRGWALPLELAATFQLPSETDMKVIRIQPMKDVTVKEAALLCHVRGIESRNERRWDLAGGGAQRDTRGKSGAASLEALTEQFIDGLSVSHPSTVSTINRTGDKLVFPGDPASIELCPVCQMPVDPSALEWKSRTALTSLSTMVKSSNGKSEPASGQTLASMLCYACLTTFTPATTRSNPLPDPVPLPHWIGARYHQRSAMRNEIKEFLLDDDGT